MEKRADATKSAYVFGAEEPQLTDSALPYKHRKAEHTSYLKAKSREKRTPLGQAALVGGLFGAGLGTLAGSPGGARGAIVGAGIGGMGGALLGMGMSEGDASRIRAAKKIVRDSDFDAATIRAIKSQRDVEVTHAILKEHQKDRKEQRRHETILNRLDRIEDRGSVSRSGFRPSDRYPRSARVRLARARLDSERRRRDSFSKVAGLERFVRVRKAYEKAKKGGTLTPELRQAYRTSSDALERRIEAYNRKTTTLAEPNWRDPSKSKPMGVKDVGFDLPHGGFGTRQSGYREGGGFRRAGTETSPPSLDDVQAMRGEGPRRASALRSASAAEKKRITRRFRSRWLTARAHHKRRGY